MYHHIVLLALLFQPPLLTRNCPFTAEAQSSTPNNFIPETFPNQDISQYTFRYVAEYGADTPGCLSSQPYPPSNEVTYCGTLRFALLGGHGLRNTDNATNFVVLLQPGSYPYGNESVEVRGYRNVVISKVPNTDGEVVLHCIDNKEIAYNNLYITYSEYVGISNIVFERCGPQSPGMGTFNVAELVISDCIARNNLHSGIITYQSNDMLFENCLFENNNSTAQYNESKELDPGQLRFAGGLSISWENYTTIGSATVRNCTFMNNSAAISQFNQNDTRPNLYIPRGHGGAIIAHFDNTNHHTLTIEHTRIYNNTALYNGGGAFFPFYRGSIANRVVIRNTVFENNTCNSAGGGVSMSTFQKANENKVSFENTTFKSNVAAVGGGAFSINIQDQLTVEDNLFLSNTASFDNCIIEENSSPKGGSAISLVSNARVDQALDTTHFKDCRAGRCSDEFSFPDMLSGTNIFVNNSGGGVALLQSRMDVKGTLWFEGNTAEVGGALAFQDQSLLQLLPNANITFLRNHANYRGGAISAIAPSVGLDTDIIRLFNTRCFIQYDVLNTADSTPPSEWNANINFIDNTAGYDGAAIYATNIERCTYTPSRDSIEASNFNEMSMFQLTGLFYFSPGNRVVDRVVTRTNESISTAPSQLFVSPQSVSGAPGEIIDFNVRAADQSGNWQRAVWSLHDNSIQETNRSQEYFVLPTEGNIYSYTVHGQDGESYDNCSKNDQTKLNFNLIQIVAGDIANYTVVDVNVTCCHPAYFFNSAKKVCDHDHRIQIIVRGDVNQHYVYIEPEHYAEVRNGTVVSAIIPPTFQNCSSQGTLRGCLFKYDKPDEQCADGRSGFLCGHCPANQSLDLTLRACKECTPDDAVIVAVIVILFVVTSVLALIFNIGVPNDLKGCFFFIQVVGFIYQQSSTIPWDFHLSRLFGFSFYLPLCAYPGYSALLTASYGLILSAFAFITIVVYIISAKFIRPLSSRASFEGIWLLCIVTYKYTADTAFLLLRCQKVTGEGVHGEFVFFYDGTIKCFDQSEGHLWFAIVALFIGALVLVFPVVILVISYRRFKHTQAFTDVLTNGVKDSYRWWSFFDLFRRLMFVIVVFFFNYVQPDYSQLALFFLGLIIFFVFACVQPYKERRSNIIEAFVLLDLLILTALFLNTDGRSKAAVFVLAVILLLLPFFFALVYVIIKIVSLIWKRSSPKSFMEFCMHFHDLVMKGYWHSKAKGGITHDLDVFVDIDEEGNETIVEPEPEAELSLQGDYSAYREELLDL